MKDKVGIPSLSPDVIYTGLIMAVKIIREERALLFKFHHLHVLVCVCLLNYLKWEHILELL